MAHTDIAIPARMQHLKLDARGYPIFYVAMIDKNGNPHLAINDTNRRIMCAKFDLCSICGGKLFRGRWFIGGPMSAFHPHGFFSDAPMHFECAHYALLVCPWLALSKYKRSATTEKAIIGKIADGKIALETGQVLIDESQMANRPLVFVAVMAVGQDFTKGTVAPLFKPKQPYRVVEYWIHGRQLDDEEGRAKVMEYLKSPDIDEAYRDIVVPPVKFKVRRERGIQLPGLPRAASPDHGDDVQPAGPVSERQEPQGGSGVG